MRFFFPIFLLAALFPASLMAEAPVITSTMTLQQMTKLTASDAAAGDWFGQSVAVSGDTAIVGAYGDDGSGSAYVYTLNPENGLFEQRAKLTASDGAAADKFGISVAISGDTVIVGAYGDDGSGSAYVFEKPMAGWDDMNQTAKLTASDAAASDYFGFSVAVSDDTVVVGAWGNDSFLGAAYLFEKPVSGWSNMHETARLSGSDGAAGDNLGISVAVSGDTVVVGAQFNNGGTPFSGSAYLFKEPGTGWVDMNQTAKLTASVPAGNDDFGYSVAVSGDTVVVGAFNDDDGGNDSGSAYLFEKPVSGWSNMHETAKLTASDAAADDWFGRSVTVSGRTVVVGAYYDDDGGSDSGAAYFFEKPVSGWSNMHETAKLTASDAAASDYFGRSVAVSGDTIVVGAVYDDDAGDNSGSAYPFRNVLAVNSVENKREVIDIEAVDAEGDIISFAITGGNDAGLFSIDASSGLLRFRSAPDYEAPADSNGDNVYELQIKTSDDFYEESFHRAFIRVSDIEYEGRAPRAVVFKELNKFTAPSAADNVFLGCSVAVSGNTAIVGAYGYNGFAGAAYVYEYDETTGAFVQKARLRSSVPEANDRFGERVAISGDTIVVGSSGDDDGGDGSGAAYIFEKPLSGGWVNSTENAKLTASDPAAGDGFGASVAIRGDTAIVGAFWDDDGGNNSGSAYIFEKSVTGWADMTETAKITASDAAADDRFGLSVAIGGDTVVVGAHGNDGVGNWSGSAYIFEKPLAGWVGMTETAKLTASIPTVNAAFGYSVAVSGDTVVIGADQDDAGAPYSGSVYLFEKPLAGWSDMNETAQLTASDPADDDEFGYSVAISGNIVVVGAYYNDGTTTESGSAYLFEKPTVGWNDMNETVRITASDGMYGDEFGYCVAVSGGTVLVGAPYYDEGPYTSSGAAYVYKANTALGINPGIIMLLLP